MQVQALIRDEGGEGFALSGDIGNKDEAERAVAQVLERFGRVHILVNNAGEQHVQDKVEDVSEDQLKSTFATNIFGQFYMVQSVVPQMRKSDAIINFTSAAAFRGQPTLFDYS